MCGIFAIFNGTGDLLSIRQRALKSSSKLRHRGPDWNGIETVYNHAICHERLAIVGDSTGHQPFVNESCSVFMSVNGEIYNHMTLRDKLNTQKASHTSCYSDCEVIMLLYQEKRTGEFIDLLNGIYAFVLYDSGNDNLLVARDPFGVIPLYHGYNSKSGSTYFASELKALIDDCDIIRCFPPSTFIHVPISSASGEDLVKGKYDQCHYQRNWISGYLPKLETFPEPNLDGIRTGLERAVTRQLMADVPFGVLLSGGLDSSLISAIAARQTSRQNMALKSFSIGIKGAPDLIAAKQVANFIGTDHYEFNFTVQEGFDAIPDLIYYLETFDVTTIRASTPMYLLARRIKSLGIKMVLSGEGSDEIFGGYLYFFKAPNAHEFHKETVKRVKDLHLFDCLRANKSTMAFGVEARVPFLDKDFVDFCFQEIAPEHKVCNANTPEKYILRKAFDDQSQPYLPNNILWRQKEQFSDGVGYNWITKLKEMTDSIVSDDEFKQARFKFPDDQISSKEAYYYRKIYEQHFENAAALDTISRWIPRQDWGCSEDPSGRAQKDHVSAY